MRLSALTRVHVLASLLFIYAIPALTAEPPQYKDYKRPRRKVEYFELSFDKTDVTVTVFHNGRADSRTFPGNTIEKREQSVVFGASVRFDSDGLRFGDETFPYDRISDTRVIGSDGLVTITFYTHRGSSDRVRRLRRGNRIEFSRNIVVEKDEFVRGLVFSVAGDIEVYGEVNKDIITILGKAYLRPGAVVRGDIASVAGYIEIAGDASVYGEVYSKNRRAVHRRLLRQRP